MSTTRLICLITVFVCLLTISNFSSGFCWDSVYEWNPAGSDCSWDNPANWSYGACPMFPLCIPGPGDGVIIEPHPPGPCITGDAACCSLRIMPWSWADAPDCEVDVYSGNVNFGNGIEIAASGAFDSSTSGKGILKVLGGTVTTPSEGSEGMVIGSQFGPSYGRLIMYGGSISVPAVALYYGDIALYGGTLECTGDSNFVFSQVRPQNKIDISCGMLHIHGNATSALSDLIANGLIYSSRGILTTPLYNGTWTTLISSYNDMVNAWGPSPANLATNVHYRVGDVNVGITLSWNDGEPNVVNHDVYFGTTLTDVNAATKTSPQFQFEVNEAGAEPNTFTISNFNFKLNTNYYWRVDSNSLVNDGNIVNSKGHVWSFKTHDGKASNPRPRNGQVGLSEPLALSWTAGDFAAATNGHFVYIGTDAATVTAATSTTAKVFRGRQTDTYYSLDKLATGWYATPLIPGATYYWKITEINGTSQWGAGLASAVVWSFTPSSVITIDDFEDYNSTADMNILWQDLTSNGGTGYTMTCPIPPDLGGGTMAVTPSGRMSFVLDADGKHGNFAYDNTTGSRQFSQVKRYYGSSGTVFSDSNVLSEQPTEIRVDYIGAATNDVHEVYDRMYLAFEDSAGNVGVYLNPDGNVAIVTGWTQWHVSLKDIHLAGYPYVVKLAAVSAFYLGFGERCLLPDSQDTGGDGNVMFDNIQLLRGCDWPGAFSADFDGDCYVDLYDFALMAQVWLMDCPASHPCIATGPACTPPNSCPEYVIEYPIVDLNGDDIIDFKDFDILADEWKIIQLWP